MGKPGKLESWKAGNHIADSARGAIKFILITLYNLSYQALIKFSIYQYRHTIDYKFDSYILVYLVCTYIRSTRNKDVRMWWQLL